MHSTHRSWPVILPWVGDAVLLARHQCRGRLHNGGKVRVLVVLLAYKPLFKVVYSSVSLVRFLIAVVGVV